MAFKEHSVCRVCQTQTLEPVFDMGNHPLANDHCLPGEPRQGFYPLRIMACGNCGLAQLSAVVDRDLLYRRYSYVSSSSGTMRRHYDRLFLDIESERTEKTVCELGSNNGDLLKFAQGRDWRVLGIDPARNISEIAQKQGVPTLAEFFGTITASIAKDTMPNPGLILARHVFAHMDDWVEFFNALEILAGPETLIALEFPYLGDFLSKLSWDTAYHEHLNVISLKPLALLLRHTPFHIHRVTRMGVHGGVLLLMLRHRDSTREAHLSADELLSEEKITRRDWETFATKSLEKIRSLKDMVEGFKNEGKIVSIFGASAKTTVLARACRFDTESISFCTDNSPLKPGRLIPGTSIPIIDEGEMLSMHPHVALCGAWNYRAEILEKMSKYRQRGGKFVFPTDTGWETV